MLTLLMTFGSALLGVIGTLLINWLDLKQRARRQLVPVVRDIEVWERKMDEALVKNDNDGIAVAANILGKLQQNKADILRQL